MLWYVALVAILNLMLGYGLAVLTGARRSETAPVDVLIPNHPTEAVPYSTATSDLAAARLNSPKSEAASPPVVSGATAPTPDSATRLASREHAEQLLAEIARTGGNNNPVTVALLELDGADQLEQALDERLLHGVAYTIHELLSDVGTVARYGEQQLLLTLPQDASHGATARAEQVRGRIQATQYVADGRDLKTTVTCALVDVADQPVLQLLECLEETLAEAKRCGGNRTFLHDGKSPAPVVPQELSFPSQKCAI